MLSLSLLFETEPVCYFSCSFSVFSEEVERFSVQETLRDFIQYVDSIISVALIEEAGSGLLMHCVLTFYEFVSFIICKLQ